MAKYFVTLVLLACVALESTSIHNRMFAKSEVFKHPHPRHQKYASTEISDHNAHHNHHSSSKHKHHHSHESHDHQGHHDGEYVISDERQMLEDPSAGAFDEDDREKSEEWSLAHGSHKPNLWKILKSKSSRSSNEDDEADMLGDGIISSFVDNELDEAVKRGSTNSNKRQKSESQTSVKCPKCESHSQHLRVSEEELTRLRIEFVKRQILEKLRLKNKPNVSAMGMPKPIYEETTIQHDETANPKDLDDYYARASKKFIFLEREKQECHHLSQPSICFSFKIDDIDAESIDVSTAVLWIYRKRNRKDFLKQTIVVSEVEQGGHNSKYLPKVKPIAIQSVDVQEGWMKIDIEWPIKRWFGIHDLSHLIHISCQSCEVDSADSLISTEKDYRPFIMIDTQNRRRVSRQKRSVNCTDGLSECCREKLYISFDEIGWGDWIIRPRGYDAYFCRGSCSTAASIAQSSTTHASLMRKVISHRETTGKKPLELISCCTANQHSSLEIFFRDSNNTASLMKLPNMVIESCGCM